MGGFFMEKLTPTDKVLYTNLGLIREDAPQRDLVGSVFPQDFATGELLTSMHTMGEILYQALRGEPVRETRNSLIRFGVLAATVFDESRISLSLVEAQTRIQVDQGLPPLNRTKRDLLHREYADALQQAEAPAQLIYSSVA
jgi:hypothetical protein